jgi:hypothetical protein
MQGETGERESPFCWRDGQSGFHLSSHGLANTTGTGTPLAIEVVL